MLNKMENYQNILYMIDVYNHLWYLVIIYYKMN
jgi:hypothetical protein